LVLAITTLIAGGHTPYGQWTVYRRRNLFVVASRDDPEALRLAKELVEGLARELPESRAMMTRASDSVRIASLLATDQLEVAILAPHEAQEMLAGAGKYRATGPVPLRVLAKLDGHLLVTVESFRNRHAFLLAQAVDHLRAGSAAAASASHSPLTVPDHPGAVAYRNGLPLPEAEDEEQ
jgi:hypothetical protein